MKRYFEFNWFDDQIGLFNHFLTPLKGAKNLNFLEIGSFEGNSTCWCLDNILSDKSSKITCVDSWQGGFEHSSLNMKNIEDRFLNNIGDKITNVEILKGQSKEILCNISSRKNYYDFIYVDGGHTVKDVLPDLILSFDLLKSGGMMAMDDYPWGSQDLHISKKPQLAIDAFLIGWQEEFQILHKQYQVWIKKK